MSIVFVLRTVCSVEGNSLRDSRRRDQKNIETQRHKDTKKIHFLTRSSKLLFLCVSVFQLKN
jgi:hypothetical protein